MDLCFGPMYRLFRRLRRPNGRVIWRACSGILVIRYTAQCVLVTHTCILAEGGCALTIVVDLCVSLSLLPKRFIFDHMSRSLERQKRRLVV